MQNIEEEDLEEPETGSSKIMKPMKALKKIQNNKYANQNIYQLYVQKRFTECLKLIDSCQPDQYKYYMKSLVFKEQFKLQTSLELLTECQILNKINFTYLKAIAKNFYLLGKYKSSLQVAKDAYKLSSTDFQILYIMGKISLALKDVENAKFNFERSAAKQPNQQSYIELAKIEQSQGNYEKAAIQLKNSLKVSAQNPQIYAMLGDIYIKFHQKEQAMKYFLSALERDPNNYDSLFTLGAIKEEEQQISEAYDYYTKAYKYSSNSAALWNNIGANMLNKRKDIVAYCCLKRALFLDPFKWDIHANLGKLFMRKNKYLSAQIHLRSAIRLKQDPYLYNVLGICLCELGDLVNAQKSFEEGHKILNDEECKCNHICLLLKMGQFDKARKLYEEMESEGSQIMGIKEKLVEIKRYL